jgi:hypothetical protein
VKTKEQQETEQAALVRAYRDIDHIVLEDIARLVNAQKNAGEVLARMIQLRGRK